MNQFRIIFAAYTQKIITCSKFVNNLIIYFIKSHMVKRKRKIQTKQGTNEFLACA